MIFKKKDKESDRTVDAATTEEVTEFLQALSYCNRKGAYLLCISISEVSRPKATQISQFNLTLEKDSNWKIVK